MQAATPTGMLGLSPHTEVLVVKTCQPGRFCAFIAALWAGFASQALAQPDTSPPPPVNFGTADPAIDRFTVEAIFLQRSRAVGPLLFEAQGPQDLLFYAHDLSYESGAGPRITYTYQQPESWGFEVRYFSVVTPESSFDLDPEYGSLLIDINGTEFVDSPIFFVSSQLYSTEVNLRKECTPWFTFIFGFRWLEFHDHYGVQATALGEDEDSFDLLHLVNTSNHLYGAQLGSEILLLQHDAFTLNLRLMAGIYGNCASQSSYLDLGGSIYTAHDERAQVAFVGEIGLNAKYQLTDGWSLIAGYNLLWIDGVALTTKQLQTTDLGAGTAVINTNGDVFYHGANIGIEFTW